MRPRDKMLSAFTPGGASEVGVVTCYDDIFIRDHWYDLTDVPWHFKGSGIIDQEVAWARDVSQNSGIEWLAVTPCPSRQERRRWRFEKRGDGTYRVDKLTREETKVEGPIRGGYSTADESGTRSDSPPLPTTQEEADALIPDVPEFCPETFRRDGRDDMAAAVRESLDLMLYAYASSPLWSLYWISGYEGMMLLVAERPDLARYAAKRLVKRFSYQVSQAAALGVDAVWIEECLTDQISPQAYSTLDLPILKKCVGLVRDHGLKSIYYYCGNPNDRIEHILDVGADAVHFEEGKKGFQIDIELIAAKIDGRCTLFGNLDAIGVLQDGSDSELEAEIRRQLRAASRNRGRFVMSTGSPITPGTTVDRVKHYTDLVRKLGKLPR